MINDRRNSFSAWLDQGKSEQEIRQYFAMTKQNFDRAKADVDRIRSEKK